MSHDAWEDAQGVILTLLLKELTIQEESLAKFQCDNQERNSRWDSMGVNISYILPPNK